MDAIFFDLDGTLIDSRADLGATVNFTRRELGLAPIPLEEAISHVGRGARYLLEHAIPEIAGRFDEIWPLYKEQYRRHMLDATRLYPGVQRTLAELHDRGWLMGINTNKPNFATHAILAHFGLARYFGAAVVAGGDCAEMKPSAQPLRQAAAQMRGHRLSSRDWMVGDNWTDMDSGANAGVKTAFCTYGFGHLNESRHTVKIDRIDELLRYCAATDE
ncbi:MAG: HAD family hydrolase [Kiritimatiellia bacterium]